MRLLSLSSALLCLGFICAQAQEIDYDGNPLRAPMKREAVAIDHDPGDIAAGESGGLDARNLHDRDVGPNVHQHPYMKLDSNFLLNQFRAHKSTPQIPYDDALAMLSIVDADNCSFEYDYFKPVGQTYFSIGYENNTTPIDPPWQNLTRAGFKFWTDEKVNYTITSDQYANLTAFYWTWEFTQLMWRSSTKFGCGWSQHYCPNRDPDSPVKWVLQMICSFTPPGNRWEQFGGNVTCADCKAQPQTTTIVPSPIPTKRAEATAFAKHDELD